MQETLTIVDLELVDYERMAELVEVYADFPLGTADAAVVAVAERLGITEIATLDRHHFHAVRPRHTGGFQLLPGSSAGDGRAAGSRRRRRRYAGWSSWCELTSHGAVEGAGGAQSVTVVAGRGRGERLHRHRRVEHG